MRWQGMAVSKCCSPTPRLSPGHKPSWPGLFSGDQRGAVRRQIARVRGVPAIALGARPAPASNSRACPFRKLGEHRQHEIKPSREVETAERFNTARVARLERLRALVHAFIRSAGIRFGRKRKLTDHQRKEAVGRRGNGETLAQIARSYAVSVSMISRL
jgi:hypothetical protein